MAKARLVLSCDAQDIPALLEALADTPMQERVQVELAGEDGGAEPEPIRRRRVPAIRKAERMQQIPSVVYRFTRRKTAAQVRSLRLTPAQRTVLAYIMQHGPVSMRDTQAGLPRVNPKTVDGSIFALRHHKPPLLESIANPDAE